MMQLDYSSSAVKSATDPVLENDLKAILSATRPEVADSGNPDDDKLSLRNSKFEISM